MIERRQHTRFALESRQPLGVRRERVRQDLDRHIAPEARVVRAVHLAHAAGTQRRNHGVVAQAIASGQPGRRGAADTPRVDAVRSSASNDSDATGHFRQGRAGGVGRKQRFDIPAQRFIARDCGRQERGAFGQAAVRRRLRTAV